MNPPANESTANSPARRRTTGTVRRRVSEAGGARLDATFDSATESAGGVGAEEPDGEERSEVGPVAR